MRVSAILALALAIGPLTASDALAQRFPFERSFNVGDAPALDVMTNRGKIDVVSGARDRIVVRGIVTVRVGLALPANATELARQIADNPPVEQDGDIVRLRPPKQAAAWRSVTVSYEVEVPPAADVRTESDSGATTIRGVGGPVSVRTQSGSIDVHRLGGAATVTTGSGAVTISGVVAALNVTTSSSAISARDIQGNARVRSGSGAIDVVMSGSGAVDVETSSSAIHLRHLRGTLTALSKSGRVTVQGEPKESWSISTASGSVDLSTPDGALMFDLTSGSGSVDVSGATVQGVVTKHSVSGATGTGGPRVRVHSRSGSIRVRVRESAGPRQTTQLRPAALASYMRRSAVRRVASKS